MEVHVVVSIILWFLFHALRLVFTFGQRLKWKINGVDKRIQRIINGSCTAEVQIKHVVLKYKMDADFTYDEDFITVHSGFDQPECILQNDITLYCLTRNTAVFVKVPEHINIYSSDTHPFFYAAQHASATHVIVMSIACYHKVATKIGNPKAKIIIATGTGRCGSTALGQIFEALPGVITLSEPPILPLEYLVHHFNITDYKYDDVLADSIRVLCKPQPNNPTIFYIKAKSNCLVQIPRIVKHFPDAITLFMFRDGYKTVNSFYRIALNNGTACLSMFLNKFAILRSLLPTQANLMREFGLQHMDEFPWIDEDLYINIDSITLLAIHWASLCAYYKLLLERGFKIGGIQYEDLVGNPENTCERLFEFCGISRDYIPIALDSLKKESHRGTSFAASVTGDRMRLSLRELKSKADHFNKKLEIPPFGDEIILPGVITKQ